MVLIVGSIQMVSKLVSEAPNQAQALKKRTLLLQSYIGGIISCVVWLAATPLSELFFRDAGLAPFLRVGSGVTFLYALYAVYVGLANGLKLFALQAALDILFSTLKVGLILGLVLAGMGVMGAFTGFLAAALITVICANWLVGRRLGPSRAGTYSNRRLLTLLIPLVGSTLMLNLLLLLAGPIEAHLHDPEKLRAITGGMLPDDLALASAMEAGWAQRATNHIAGLLGAAKNIALLPYQATFALTFIIFPMLSKATFESDHEKARAFVQQTTRMVLIIATVLCCALTSTAEPLLRTLFGAPYAVAHEALVLLLIGTVFMALLVISITILNAAGRERTALLVSTGTVLVQGGLLVFFLGATPDSGLNVLEKAAWSSLIAALTGLSVAAWIIYRQFGAFAPLGTWIRLLATCGGIAALAPMWPVETLVGVLFKLAGMSILCLVALIPLGELTPSDRDAIRQIIGRKA
jgi:O-antigen/teichoic acid export membrane protein